MDSVLSVEGSQIYWQSAFNKKQVARKVHCRATKDVNTAKTASIRSEMLTLEGAHVCVSLRAYTLRWVMNGRMEFLMQTSDQAVAATSSATGAADKRPFPQADMCTFMTLQVHLVTLWRARPPRLYAESSSNWQLQQQNTTSTLIHHYQQCNNVIQSLRQSHFPAQWYFKYI